MPDGIRLTTGDPILARQREVAEEIMRKDRNVLRKLAQWIRSSRIERPLAIAIREQPVRG